MPRSNSDSGNFLNGLTNNERSLQKSQITKSATDLVQPNNLPTSGRRMKDDKASKQRQSDWIVGKDWIYPNIVPYIDSRNGLTDLPSEWTIDEVEAYISTIGFPDQAHVFREEEIDGRSLLLLKRTDVLKGLPLKLGPALKIYAHIHQLQAIEYFRSNPKINNAKKDPEEAPRDEQETAIQAEVTSTTTTAVSQ